MLQDCVDAHYPNKGRGQRLIARLQQKSALKGFAFCNPVCWLLSSRTVEWFGLEGVSEDHLVWEKQDHLV